MLFIILIMSSLISDYILRLKFSDFYPNGLNETIWFGIHIIAFINLILLIKKPQLNFFYIKKLLIHKKTKEGMKKFTKDVIPEYAKILGK